MAMEGPCIVLCAREASERVCQPLSGAGVRGSLGRMTIQHVVIWRFTPDIDEADQAELRQRVRDLR